MLEPRRTIEMPSDCPPRLLVVVDTEEEFDWSAEPDPDADSVNSIGELHRAQEIFDEFGIRPTYVVDYPVATNELSIQVLKSIVARGVCEIGAHLHPWVNPPLREPLSRSNMYPGNLPETLEREKLTVLTDAIEESFGYQPTVYKAGRYGVGPHTATILEELNYEVDLSYCPAFDYSDDGGPDFSSSDTRPFWFGQSRTLLGIPLSGAFVGFAGRLSANLYNTAGYFPKMKARGILSRLNAVDRLMLSPEGYKPTEHRKLTKFLYNKGVRTFTWNFHSPSVMPGMTMYTRSKSDVESFLDSFREYFKFFFNELGGVATTPSELKQQLEQQ